MNLFDRLLKVYSVGFTSLLCLFLLGISLVAKLSGSTLELPMLPWSGASLTNWTLGLSLFGLVSGALAIREKLRWLLAIFTVYVFCQMAWGFFAGPHRFDGYDDFRGTVSMTMSAFAAAGAAVRNAWRRAA